MGYIPDDQINRLKESLDIVDVVSSYVSLKPAGANLKGLCPFHHEKTPSFTVNRQKNFYHCFGCGQGGDAIDFIMKIENLDYISAVRFLADKNGIILDEENYNREASEKLKRLYKINSLVAKYYFRNMLVEKAPQDYIHQRGLDIKVVNAFFLGYAKQKSDSPDSWGKDLFNFLLSQNVSVEDMLELGLVDRSKKDKSYYDKFRDRLIFPILNNKRRVIGFGGRTLVDNKIKYLNSPESPVFHKGDNLYGITNLQARVSRDKVILVEGYMDVIALYNHGIDYAAASLGTALTERQATILKRYGKQIYIAYDGDQAGIKASLRAIEIFDKIGIEPRIVEFPNEMDPDEFIKSQGLNAFEKALKDSKKALDYRMQLEIDKPGDKFDLTERMINFLVSIKGNAKREIYGQKIANSVGISFESLMKDVASSLDKANKLEDSKKILGKTTYDRRFQSNNGYHNIQTNSELKDFSPPISRDQLRLKLEKEILSKMLLNREFFILLEDIAKEFITSDQLLDLYGLVEREYSSESYDIDQLVSSQAFSLANIGPTYEQDKRGYVEGSEKGLSEELRRRVMKFILIDRRDEITRQLRENISQEKRDILYKELVDVTRELTQY